MQELAILLPLLHLTRIQDQLVSQTEVVLDDGKLTQRHVLRSHQKPVSFVAWSPDDTMLLTCGNIEVLNLWDVETVRTLKKAYTCGTVRVMRSDLGKGCGCQRF
ncbi:uncharacterized protein LOC124893780 isoform X4 [Capsicum annuum]|uniref:uncharacterized protein LOC124893780 isoform X4 n=1 Tax=Capsicum annuum TaxID=4072 RepID=UPI001FB0F20D|nr:uncharacterized protein LOC124893780 isoform X4 [Capsicum annuum]